MQSTKSFKAPVTGTQLSVIERYTTAQRIAILKIQYKNGETVRNIRTLLRHHFAPSRNMKFDSTGSVQTVTIPKLKDDIKRVIG